MSVEEPIIPYLKKDGQSKEKSYVQELEERVKDLVEIRDHFKQEAKASNAKVEILMEVIEVLK